MSDGESCESGSNLLGRGGLGFQIMLLGFGLGALMGLAARGRPVYGQDLGLILCFGLSVGIGLELE